MSDGVMPAERGLRASIGRLLLTAVFAASCAMPVRAELRVQDDLGNVMTLAGPAQRIVTLAPHVTELLFAAGAGARVVAAVAYSDYPAAARALPRVGDASRIDHERVLALRPDLVVAWASGTPARELATLRRLGLPLFLSEPRRLPDIGAQLRVLGRVAGTEAAAEAAAVDYERRLAVLRARYERLPSRRVFYQLALRPLLTVNGAHIIQDVLRVCGAENPFAGLSPLTPQVAVEAVLDAAPEAVIVALYPGEDIDASRRFWRRYGLPEQVRVIGVPGDYIHRATPRILDGVERICEGLAAP